MLGGMHVDIHLMRIDFQVEYIGWLLVGLQLRLKRLTYRMIDQFVAHHAAVDVAILNIGQLARSGRIGDPAAQQQIVMSPVDA